MFENFLKALLLASCSGGVACIILMLLKKTLLKNCGGRAYYYIWLIPVLLFLTPFRPSAATIALPRPELFTSYSSAGSAAVSERDLADRQGLETAAQAEAETVNANVDPPSTKIPPDISVYIFTGWICGALVIFLRQLIKYNRCQYQLTHLGCMPVSENSRIILAETKNAMNINRDIALISSAHTTSPLTTGFFTPKIILPDRELTDEECRLIFRHELTHYKRGDIWYKLIASAANAMQWFNPLSYLTVRNVGESCEYSCDEAVTRDMDAESRRVYSEMILNMMSFHTLDAGLASHLSKNKKILKRRFYFIMKTQKHKKLIGGLAALSVLALSVLPSSLTFAADKEFYDTTYYNTYYDYDYNIRSVLQLPLDSDGVGVYANSSGQYIDSDGYDTIYPSYSGNTDAPALFVYTDWIAKDSAAQEGAVVKDYVIDGNALQVLFTSDTAAYSNNAAIDKMIQNRFRHELSYSSPYGYDHPGFIKQLMRLGYFRIGTVLEPDEFEPIFETTAEDGGVVAYSVQSEANKIDNAYRIWNQKMVLAPNVDGGQGKQFGNDFIIPTGGTLAIDIDATSESLSGVNVAIVNATTGYTVDWIPNISAKTRFTYTPSNYAGNTFRIMISTEDSQGGEAELSSYVY